MGTSLIKLTLGKVANNTRIPGDGADDVEKDWRPEWVDGIENS